MKLPPLIIHSEFVSIPEVFYASDTGKPLANCISCDKYLLQPGVGYMIEKAVKNYKKFKTNDTIFEYALCFACYESIQGAFSEISKQRIDEYMQKHVNLVERRKQLLERDRLTVEPWISHCMVKGTPADELSEYQIVCQCEGDKMIFTYAPLMIGAEAIDEVAQLLSNKTLGEIDGLYRDFFNLPPELQDLVDGPRFALV